MKNPCHGSIVSALFVICLFLIPFAGFGFAGDNWIALNGTGGEEAPLLTVEQSDFSLARLSMNLHGMKSGEYQTHAGTFALLSLGEYGYTTEIGLPRLPVIREMLEIPYGATAHLRLIDPVYQEYDLADLGVEARIIPAQAPVSKNHRPDGAPLVVDTAVYTTDRYCLDQETHFQVEGFIRGSRVALMEIFPINYNPVQGRIKVLTQATIEVAFTGADSALTQAMLDRYSNDDFDALTAQVLVNNKMFKQTCIPQGKRGARSTGYLIIAHTSFAANASLQSFADYKNSVGFEVTLVDSATAGGNKQGIKNYIVNAVENWPCPPAYVLLVGDTSHIGYWVGGGAGSPDTDLPYAQIRGADYFPDIFVGRFSVTSGTHVDRIVQKTLAMESVTHKKSTFMASEDNYNISEGTHNWVISNYLSGAGWTYDKLYCHTNNANTSQVSNAINNGRSLLIYSGHGSTTSWADGPSFSKSNVQALNNSFYPVVMSFACSTGDYAYSECFAETWIRDDKAGTLFWGASVSSYWTEDDVLEKRIVEGWYDHGQDRFAQMADYGKYKLYQFLGGGSTARRYYEMYNIMGDPSIKVLAEEPGGTFTNLGVGIASTLYGEPTITGTGDLTPGGLGFKVTLDSVKPSAFGILFTGGVNSGGIPLVGGLLYPFPFAQTFALTVGGAGSLEINATLPPDFTPGVHVYVQVFFDDASGPFGASATDCLDMYIN